MSRKIYLIQSNNTLQALSQQPYPNEDLFQGLLEKYPDLLAGDQMDEVNPRRWLLVVPFPKTVSPVVRASPSPSSPPTRLAAISRSARMGTCRNEAVNPLT